MNKIWTLHALFFFLHKNYHYWMKLSDRVLSSELFNVHSSFSHSTLLGWSALLPEVKSWTFNVFTRRLYSWTHNYRLISTIRLYHIFIAEDSTQFCLCIAARVLHAQTHRCVCDETSLFFGYILLLIHKIALHAAARSSPSHHRLSHLKDRKKEIYICI